MLSNMVVDMDMPLQRGIVDDVDVAGDVGHADKLVVGVDVNVFEGGRSARGFRTSGRCVRPTGHSEILLASERRRSLGPS